MNWLSALDSPVYHSRNRASAKAVPRTRAGVLQAGAGAGAGTGAGTGAGPDETCAALEVRGVESGSLLKDMVELWLILVVFVPVAVVLLFERACGRIPPFFRKLIRCGQSPNTPMVVQRMAKGVNKRLRIRMDIIKVTVRRYSMRANILELLGRIVEIGKIKAKLTDSCSRLDIEVMEKLCGTLKGRV